MCIYVHIYNSLFLHSVRGKMLHLASEKQNFAFNNKKKVTAMYFSMSLFLSGKIT